MMAASTKRFTILTESETSKEFCRSLKQGDFINHHDAAEHLAKDNFIVVDAGGGTVDVSIVKKSNESVESYVHDTSGGRWGSETINEKFEELVSNESKSVRSFLDSFQDVLSLWLEFVNDYEGAKSRTAAQDVAIHLKDKFARNYEELVEKSFFDSFGENTKVKSDKGRGNIILRAKYLQKRKFDEEFESWKQMFYENHENETFDRFYDDFLSEEREFYANKDRLHDVVMRMDREFLDKFNALRGKPFAESLPEELTFDKDNDELRIPSYVMSWGFYDQIISEKGRILSKSVKHRVEFWRQFMGRFERAKREFDGNVDIKVSLKGLKKESQTFAGGNFLNDIDHSGIEVDWVKEEMVIKRDILKEKCFDPILKKLLSLLEKAYKRVPTIQVLYMVGGFGKHKYMQRFIRERFADDRQITVLVPKDASKSVLDGTIKFAYNRVSTVEHQAQFTFFVQEMVRNSMPDLRKPTKLQCTTVVRKGDRVQVSEINRQEISPYTNDSCQFIVEVFASSKKRPTRVDDGRSVCVFYCDNDSVHIISISFTKDDVLIFLDEKDTGKSQAKRIPKESACTIL